MSLDVSLASARVDREPIRHFTICPNSTHGSVEKCLEDSDILLRKPIVSHDRPYKLSSGGIKYSLKINEVIIYIMEC